MTLRPEALLFGEYRLDLARQELRRQGELVEVAPLAFRLIRFLALNRDRTPAREELLGEIWGGVNVGDSALHQALRNARRAVGDDGQAQAVIKTVRGLGYRFVAPVSEVKRAASTPMDHLVGRESLFASIEQAIAKLPTTGSQALFLTGAPGLGKTTVLDALERYLIGNEEGDPKMRAPIVVSGRPSARDGAPPFWLWIGVFRALGRLEALEGLREKIDATMPTLLGSDNRPDPRQGDIPDAIDERAFDVDEAERFRVFDTVSQALAEISARRPLILMLDDLHAAGAASLDLLAFLLQELRSNAFLVIGAYRRLEMTEGESSASMDRILELGHAQVHPVEPLDDEETDRLLRRRVSFDFDDRLVSRVVRHSRGNPFFALELLRHVQDLVQRVDARAASSESIDATLRMSLARMLEDRLKGLSTEAQELAHMASAAGRRIDVQLIEDVEGVGDVARSLEELIDRGFVAIGVAGERGPSFAHDLIREACYAEAARDSNYVKRLHLRFAEACSRSGRARASQIAFHRAAADPLGDRGETVRALSKAAREASESFDEKQARWAYNEALRVADQVRDFGEAERCELLLAAGENAVRGTFPDEARGHLLAALRVARSAGRWDWFVRAALGLAARDEILGLPEEEVAAVLEEALKVCPKNEPADRARLLSSLAIKVRYAAEGLGPATELIGRARSEAKRAGDPAASARVLEDASFVHWSVEDPAGWIALNHEIVQAATEARDLALVFRGVKGLATGYLEVGDFPAAVREMKRCAELARTAPAPYLRAVVALHDGARALLAGRWAEGEAHAIRASAYDLPAIGPLAAVQLFCHRLEAGRLEELESAVKSFVANAPGVGAWRFALSRVLLDAGRLDEAASELREAGPLGALPRDRNWLTAAALATESSVALRDLERCRELYDELLPYRGVNIVMGHGALFFGNLEHFLGELALALERANDARTHFERALRMHERLGCTPFALKSRWGLYRCAVLHEGAPMLDRLDDLRAEAETLEMLRLVQQMDAGPDYH